MALALLGACKKDKNMATYSGHIIRANSTNYSNSDFILYYNYSDKTQDFTQQAPFTTGGDGRFSVQAEPISQPVGVIRSTASGGCAFEVQLLSTPGSKDLGTIYCAR